MKIGEDKKGGEGGEREEERRAPWQSEEEGEIEDRPETVKEKQIEGERE